MSDEQEKCWTPYCSNCGQVVGHNKHVGERGTGPFCPGCGCVVEGGRTEGCIVCECVAILRGEK